VRELQNIMERCVITSRGGRINLKEMLPSSIETLINEIPSEERVFTEKQMADFEKQNITRALNLTNWKVSGDDGAAALLQVPSTTLSSRIRKLKIKRM
jgi:formate hydrogenlyase transcriptional activator